MSFENTSKWYHHSPAHVWTICWKLLGSTSYLFWNSLKMGGTAICLITMDLTQHVSSWMQLCLSAPWNKGQAGSVPTTKAVGCGYHVSGQVLGHGHCACHWPSMLCATYLPVHMAGDILDRHPLYLVEKVAAPGWQRKALFKSWWGCQGSGLVCGLSFGNVWL